VLLNSPGQSGGLRLCLMQHLLPPQLIQASPASRTSCRRHALLNCTHSQASPTLRAVCRRRAMLNYNVTTTMSEAEQGPQAIQCTQCSVQCLQCAAP